MGWLVFPAILAIDGIALAWLRRRGVGVRRLRYGLFTAVVFGVLLGFGDWALAGLGPPRTAPTQILEFGLVVVATGGLAFGVFEGLVLLSTSGKRAGASGGFAALALFAPVVVVVCTILVVNVVASIRQAQFEHVQDTHPFEVHDEHGVRFDAELVQVDRPNGHPARIVVDLRLRTTQDIRFVPDSSIGGSPGVCLAERRVGQSAQGPCWIPDVARPVPTILPAGYDQTTRISFTPPPVGLGQGDRFDLWVEGSTADLAYDTFGATTFVIQP